MEPDEEILEKVRFSARNSTVNFTDYNEEDLLKELEFDYCGDLNVAVSEILFGWRGEYLQKEKTTRGK